MAMMNTCGMLPKCLRTKHSLNMLVRNIQQFVPLDRRNCHCSCSGQHHLKTQQSCLKNVASRYLLHTLTSKLSQNCVKNVHTSVTVLDTMSDNKIHTASAINKITSEHLEHVSTVENTSNISTEPAEESDDDKDIRPALDAQTPSKPPVTFVNIVPGKGPPPEPPVDCCMSGCANCVWIQYAEELKNYFSLAEGNKKAKEAIEQIDNPGLQMFLKLELGLL